MVVLKVLLPILLLATVEAEDRGYNYSYCLDFALYSYKVVEHINRGNKFPDIKYEIQSNPLPDQTKNLLMQSLLFVVDRGIKTPEVAYEVALGSCIKRRDAYNNLISPWQTFYEFMQLEV
ncbi:MAG: hypothetical protein ACUZ8I_15010 [Candidatus Scalindua sp.]